MDYRKNAFPLIHFTFYVSGPGHHWVIPTIGHQMLQGEDRQARIGPKFRLDDRKIKSKTFSPPVVLQMKKSKVIHGGVIRIRVM